MQVRLLRTRDGARILQELLPIQKAREIMDHKLLQHPEAERYLNDGPCGAIDYIRYFIGDEEHCFYIFGDFEEYSTAVQS